MKRVAVFLDSPFLSGAESQMLRNVEMADNLGAEVTVFAFSEPQFISELRDAIKKMSLKTVSERVITTVPFQKSRLARAIQGHLNLITCFLWASLTLRGDKFDIVHVNNGGYPGSASSRGFLLGAALTQKGAQKFVTVNNMAVPYRASLSRSLDWFWDQIIVKLKVTWITGSDAAKSRLEAVLRLASSKVLVIPNGCPAPACRCGSGGRSQRAKRVSKSVSALSVGHLESRKGHTVLVEAISKLKTEGKLSPTWRFKIEGEGPDFAKLRAQILKEGLQESVSLIGRSPCILHEFLDADVLIHPSVSNEDLPNVISEAMALSLPIIGTRVAGIPDQVIDQVNGLLVEPGSAEELARAIENLLGDNNARKSYGAASRERYLQRFSPEIAKTRYLELYGLEGLAKF